jgi:hypothetical protein
LQNSRVEKLLQKNRPKKSKTDFLGFVLSRLWALLCWKQPLPGEGQPNKELVSGRWFRVPIRLCVYGDPLKR